MLGTVTYGGTAGDAGTGFRRLGMAVFVVGALAALGDVFTTWWIMRHVPGGYEANGAMAALMHAIGVTPALVLRGAIGLAYAWVVGGVVSGRYRLARAMLATRPWVPTVFASAAVLTAGALTLVVAHNAGLVLGSYGI